MINIKRYIVNLSEDYNEQIKNDFEYFGAEIIWVSKIMPQLIAIDTERDIKDVREFYCVVEATEDPIGFFNEVQKLIK